MLGGQAMEDLIFYDFDFNRLNDFRKCISVNWTVKFCGYGNFEAHFPLSQSNLIGMLDENMYLLCVQGEHQAIITGWEIDEDIAVFGKTPEWLMTKRAVNGFSHSSAHPAVIANAIVSAAMGDFVTIFQPVTVGSICEYSISGVRTVYDTVCEVLEKDSLGFRLLADVKSKTFNFQVYAGNDCRTTLSQSNKSAHSMICTCEIQDAATNSGWYKRKMSDMGEWNAQTNHPALENSLEKNAFTYYKITSATYTRFNLECEKGNYIYSDTDDGTWKVSETRPASVWVYSDNPLFSGAKKWDCIIDGEKTKDEAVLKLGEKTVSQTVEAEVRRLEYGSDYALGDRVRVQFETDSFKKTFIKTIKGIQIFYDVDKRGVRPILSD